LLVSCPISARRLVTTACYTQILISARENYSREAIRVVRLKKRDGRIEEVIESKIVNGVKKAGATAGEAEEVAKEVVTKLAHRTEVTAEELSGMVVTALRRVNRKAAEDFVKFRDDKLKQQKKK
jgi:transcriptional regulator NrdR family protein